MLLVQEGRMQSDRKVFGEPLDIQQSPRIEVLLNKQYLIAKIVKLCKRRELLGKLPFRSHSLILEVSY